ncbi:hypothetical protein O988_05250 [Pseudogymnoascus sp. VKM F-3808]|nr:hypothetical protein O988_05250 [Pseudogymnoascus sp. VKM F-3808]
MSAPLTLHPHPRGSSASPYTNCLLAHQACWYTATAAASAAALLITSLTRARGGVEQICIPNGADHQPRRGAADTVSAQPADDPATDLPTDAVLSAGDIALHASVAVLPADGVPADLGVICAGIRAGAGRDAPSIPGAGVSGVGGGTLGRRGGSRSAGSLLLHGVVEGARELGAGASEDDGEPEEGGVALP